MSDLIKRLRDEPYWYSIRRNGLPAAECEVWHRTCCEAADALEAKDKRIAELESVLKDREAEIKSVSGHLIYATDKIERLEAVVKAEKNLRASNVGTRAEAVCEFDNALAALNGENNGSS